MDKENFSISITTDAPPQAVFDGINHVTAWWTKDLKGNSQNLGDTFRVQFGDVHVSTQKLIELKPFEKIVWLVTDSKINFVDNKQEWEGTQIVFDISPKEDQTEIRFTHVGLKPDLQCYGACSNAWGGYIAGSLLRLISTGENQT